MILSRYLNQTCYKLILTRNKYGDRVYQQDNTPLACRLREITTTRRETQGEIYDSDALLWLDPCSGVTIGDIIICEGASYQIERITKARKLGDSTVHFLKCDLKIENILVS